MSPGVQSDQKKKKKERNRNKKRDALAKELPKMREMQETFQAEYLTRMHEGEMGWIFAWKGTSFQQCWVEVLIVLLFAGAITAVWAVTKTPGNTNAPWSLKVDTHRLLMIPIAFLTVFRTNISFSRFWEARDHVGAFTHHCRCLARRMRWNVPQRAMDNLCRLILGYVAAVRWDLHRHMVNVTALDAQEFFTRLEWEDLEAHYDCMPVVVLDWLDRAVMESAQRGSLDPQAREAVQAHIDGLQQAWMGMNKITTTPIPFPYSHLIKILLFIWLITVGIAFQSETGYFTPLVVVMIAFALFGINQTGVELEFPFGIDLNDLPMYKFATRIEKDILGVANTTRESVNQVRVDLEHVEESRFASRMSNNRMNDPTAPNVH